MRSSVVLRLSLPCLLLAGCATVSLNEAPIVDRTPRTAPAPAPTPAPSAPVTRQAPDGVYIVQRGDTLYSIALAFQQDFRDVARWNNLDDPTRLQVGQALRVAPPQGESGGGVAVAAPVTGTRGPEARPLDGTSIAASPASSAPSATGPTAATPSAGAAAPTLVPPDVTPASSPFGWAWPAGGAVVESFDASRSKGIGIGGKEGDPVNAAADGTVVYSGATLRGYGNLIIVKHDDEFISAYAHNRQILVKQGQAVKRGQRIAELGKTDTDKPKLHFEIRRGGKPVDPQLYLPRR